VPILRGPPVSSGGSGLTPCCILAERGAGALLARAAAADKTIRALIILARVVCGDETPIRSGLGPKTKKRYLQVACTSLLTYY
jgi:transposase